MTSFIRDLNGESHPIEDHNSIPKNIVTESDFDYDACFINLEGNVISWDTKPDDEMSIEEICHKFGIEDHELPLIAASRNGTEEAVRLLIQAGVSLDEKNKDGERHYV